MRRKYIEENNNNHERWLVSYADFITLLLAFFVVMYSISKVNESQYRVLSSTLSQVFNQPEYELDPIEVGKVAKSNPLNIIPSRDGADVDRLAEGKGAQEQGMVPAVLERINDELVNIFGNEISEDLLMIRGNEDWLEIELKAGLLFESGGAALSYQAEALINDLAGVLFDGSYAIRIEGHTDNQPVNTGQFASNWELSGARASAVVRQLIESGIAPYRLSAIAYGAYQPVSSNASSEGRNRNRRVVLAIARHMRIRPSAHMAKPAPKGQNLPLSVNSQSDESRSTSELVIEGEELEEPLIPGDSNIKTVTLPDGSLLFTGPDRKILPSARPEVKKSTE